MEAVCMPVSTPVYRKPARRPRRRDEVFRIEFNYNNRYFRFTVKTDYPAGPECMGWDYEVFEGRKHTYTLNHCRNEDDILCWEVKKKPVKSYDPELVQQIGRAINTHYGE